MAPVEAEPSSPPQLERAFIQNRPHLLHWRLEASGLMVKRVALKATKHFRYPSGSAQAIHGSQVNALWMLMVMRDAPGCVLYLRLPLDKTTNSVILVPAAQMTKISMPAKMFHTPCCPIFLPPMLFSLPLPFLLSQHHLLLKSPLVTRHLPDVHPTSGFLLKLLHPYLVLPRFTYNEPV